MLALIALIVLGVLVPWVVLFLLWRWLRTDAIQRLRRARLVVLGAGAVGVLIPLLRHEYLWASMSALFTILAFALMSGWLRRVLMVFGVMFLAFGVWAAVGAVHAVQGVLAPGASGWGWTLVALQALLMWCLLGFGVLCIWLGRRPLIPLRSAAAASPPPASHSVDR